MLNVSRIILRKLICACALSILGSASASGQTLSLPETWQGEWYKPKPLFQQDTIRICIVGDIMMHDEQIENASRGASGYDFTSFFSLIEKDIRNADLAIGNMEFTLGGKPYSGYPSFSAPDGFETYLADCGFDVFLCANNHIFDKRAAGAERTLEKYRQLQQTRRIWYTGLAGSEEELRQTTPLNILVKGVKLALINFTYGTNKGCEKHWPKTNYSFRKTNLGEAFPKKDEADFTLAFPHWGTEFELHHSPEQEAFAEWIIKSGADAIIGSHPHVIQDYQEKDGVPVVYSLGNAVSNMSAENTQLGLMVTLNIVRYSNGDLEMLQPSFKYIWCSRPGGYNDSYTVIPVEEFLDKREQWHGKWDYEKMVKTYNRIKK